MMNVEDLRSYCLSLDADVVEKFPFTAFKYAKDVLVFYIAGHMFCYFNIDDFSSITVKCNPGDIVELKERYQAVGPPYNGNEKFWISVCLHSDMSDDEIRSLVVKSYELVKGAKAR